MARHRPIPRRWAAFASAAAALVLGGAAQAQPVRAPAAGDVVDTGTGQSVGGWRSLGGGLYPRRVDRNQVTTETLGCCFQVFQRGRTFLVARTVAVTRDAQGGVVSARIAAVTTLTAGPDEEHTSCSLLWITPELSLRDRRTGMVRSVVIQDGRFVTLAWRDPGSFCYQD